MNYAKRENNLLGVCAAMHGVTRAATVFQATVGRAAYHQHKLLTGMLVSADPNAQEYMANLTLVRLTEIVSLRSVHTL